MGLVSVLQLLVASVLTLVQVPLAVNESRELVILATYPDSDNFSSVELSCVYEMSSPQSEAIGANFQLNGTDIKEEINEVKDFGNINGTVHIVLSQVKEGFFTCSLNGLHSNNSIGLAAQPTTEYSGESVIHKVELPDIDSTVSTELQCDIQPGALRQRYFIYWSRSITFNNFTSLVPVDMFNLTLDISSSMNDSQYQCHVTIDHDGNGTIVTYKGQLNIVKVVVNLNRMLYQDPETEQKGLSDADIGIIVSAVVASVLMIILCFLNTIFCCRVHILNFCDNNRIFYIHRHIMQLRARHLHRRYNTSTDENQQSERMSYTVPITVECQETCADEDHPLIRVEKPSLSHTPIAGPILNQGKPEFEHFTNKKKTNLENKLQREDPLIHSHETEILLHTSGPDNTRAGPILNQGRPEFEYFTEKKANFEDKLQREGPLIHTRETQILLHTSGVPIDPANTREYIPASFSPVATLSQCTHDGRCYHDEHNDFGLEIPAGAIPKGESITIDIGVALYGPFQYPEDLRPVSPVFWVCVRDQKSFQFLKPIKVTIQHCLNLENHDDIESLGLTFLKGDHEMNLCQMYQFQQAEDVVIEPLKNYGVFEATHFCSMCISSKYTKTFIKNAVFCISALIPSDISATATAYFFVTFLLNTCLSVVNKQICKDPSMKGHTQQMEEFKFSRQKELKIVPPESLPNHWEIGLMFRKKISLGDIDSFGKTPEDLKLREERGMYPPRFCVAIACCSPTARPHLARIKFKGSLSDLVFDISLNPSPLSPTASGSLIHKQDGATPLGGQPSMPELLHLEIPEGVGGNYKIFGIFLLNDQTGGKVDSFRSECHGGAKDVILKILQEWLEGKGLPVTWESLIQALRDTKLSILADQIQANLPH